MNIPKQVEELWLENKDDFESKVCGWLIGLDKNQSKIEEAKKTFNRREPLRFYTSVSKAKANSRTIVFSLRFHGQEVAMLKVNKLKYLCISKKKRGELNNKKYFFSPPPIPEGNVEWRSKDARNFFKYFKDIDVVKGFKPKSKEAFIESYIISQMSKVKGIFKNKFPYISPVLLYDRFPFQMSLPIKGNTGEPAVATGHIDILARHGHPRSTKLSVWELKRPGIDKKHLEMAINQSIIYASTIIMMLRSECGAGWYKAFGFSKLPTKLKVEAVVVIDQNQKKVFSGLIEKHLGKESLQIGDDKIIPWVAYYNESYDIVEFIPCHE